MARSWYFPRWRYVVMQCIMWIALGATLGLAGYLDHRIRSALYVSLGNPIVDGPITVQLPVGWKLSNRLGEGGASIHVAVEPNSLSSRTLTVIRHRVSRLMSPVEYMHLSGLLVGVQQETPPDPFMIDGWPGQLVGWLTPQIFAGKPSQIEVAACGVVLPDRDVVIIRFQRQGMLDSSDTRLLRQISQSVHVSGMDPVPDSSCSWPDGTTVSAPANFVVYPKQDLLRNDRMMVSESPEGDWVSARFVPLLLSADQTPSSLRQMIAADAQLDSRDTLDSQQWLSAEVIADGTDNRWRIEPQEVANVLLRRRAYVVSGPGSRAMLVILTVVYSRNDDTLDQTWNQFVDRIHFGDKAELRGQLRGGAEVATSQMPKLPRGDQWWIWSRDGAPIGWTHRLADPDANKVGQEMEIRNWEGSYTHVAQAWGWGSKTTAPWAQVERDDAEPDRMGRFAATFLERTRKTDDVITLLDMAPIVPSPSGTFPGSAPFVLGGAFPQQLAVLPNQPAAFWTDRFPGVQTELLTSPVLLLARPAESDNKELRCIEVEINGTGQLSRWYFAAAGVFDHADLANGLTLQPAAQDEVESTFASEPRLTIHANNQR
ncbi:MAG: hypothetical protein M3O30_12790 [Planctomycetota bacterium]|nr:hypothetical protein [Planctomycetota bacterium]